MKIYRCKHCGNIVSYEKDTGVRVMCCGEVMEEVIPSSTDAAVEKHIPVIKQDGNNVTVVVGEVEHSMTEEHYIEFIILETKNGVQKVKLNYNDKPEAKYVLVDNDEVISAYAYCNLHGYWKSV